MSMKHVMVDLETLGTKPGSVILSIGAVTFDLDGSGRDGRTFYQRVNIQSCLDAGMTVDGDTVEWWFHPDRDQARRALLSPRATDHHVTPRRPRRRRPTPTRRASS